MTLRILYDGWWLAYQPNSSAALHLLTLLTHLPAEMQGHIALPAPAQIPLAVEITQQIIATPNTERAHLRWEQRLLPKLAGDVHASAIHHFAGAPALFSRVPQVLSPASAWLLDPKQHPPFTSLAARLREACMQGGLSRLAGIFWPEDLPSPEHLPVFRMPRLTQPALQADFARLPSDYYLGDRPALVDLIDLKLPETYVLSHGPASPTELHVLFEAWSWAVGSIGEYYPLLLVGLSDSERLLAANLTRSYGYEKSVFALPYLTLNSLAALYRGASAIFQTNLDSPWEGSLPLAITCGKPLVALETPWSDALVGAAGYLLPGGDRAARGRALGAALITVIVEESVAERLSQAAEELAASWSSAGQIERFKNGLLAGYASLTAQQPSRK